MDFTLLLLMLSNNNELNYTNNYWQTDVCSISFTHPDILYGFHATQTTHLNTVVTVV